MRIVTFQGQDSEPRAGVVTSRADVDVVVDLSQASGGRIPSDTLGLLRAGAPAMDLARKISDSGHPGVRLEDVTLMAPVLRPPKLIAAAMNYQAHIVDDVGRDPFDRQRTVPKLFLKPVSTVSGPDSILTLPTLSDTVDWEVELACVIGTPGHDIPVAQALGHVACYTIINDISARSMNWGLTERAETHWDSFYDWLAGKWLNGFAPMGPWMVTADEVPEPQSMELQLQVNGTVFQKGSTKDMLFGVAELVAFASRLMTLEPGDVIATGTPSGVGAATGTYLKAGDVMEAWISGIGSLRTPVEAGVAPGSPR